MKMLRISSDPVGTGRAVSVMAGDGPPFTTSFATSTTRRGWRGPSPAMTGGRARRCPFPPPTCMAVVFTPLLRRQIAEHVLQPAGRVLLAQFGRGGVRYARWANRAGAHGNHFSRMRWRSRSPFPPAPCRGSTCAPHASGLVQSVAWLFDTSTRWIVQQRLRRQADAASRIPSTAFPPAQAHAVQRGELQRVLHPLLGPRRDSRAPWHRSAGSR